MGGAQGASALAVSGGSVPGFRPSHDVRRVPFRAHDGMDLNLLHVRGPRAPSRGPVLLVHGAGVRATIFQAPTRTTIIDALLEEGYDVWLENWRASIDVKPNHWTLDQAALYDHPAAVQKVLEQTGSKSLDAIIHCQGSTSFMMSVMAGLVPAVKTIVSNAVSLHPIVPPWSGFKLNAMVPVARLVTTHLNPHWGVQTEGFVSWLFTAMTKLTHQECDNTVCRLVSFSYGAGAPALWSHENISEATHGWLQEEFGFVPLRFHAQMARCVRRGSLVSVEGLDGLPSDFAERSYRGDARIAFFAGEDNLCFLPESQRASFAYFDALRPGVHSLHVVPRYGHLDMFFGENAARDVFPLMLDALAAGARPLAAAG